LPEVDNQEQFVKWFRYSSPYINAHRGKTFIILFDGEAVADNKFAEIVHDIALLNSLGIRLILVHGARYQIDQRLHSDKIETQILNGVRVTDEQTLQIVKQSVGCVRMQIEAMLSMGVANSPMAGAKIRVVSSNFVTAKPYGVHDGVDFHFTGEVRRIDAKAIEHQLDEGAIVLLSSTGYSPTGEIFSLTAEEVATRTAIAVSADKFVYLSNEWLASDNKQVSNQLSLSQAKSFLQENQSGLTQEIQTQLQCAIDVCSRGVRRAHLVNRDIPGALLLELFSRNGIGCMVSSDSYDIIRQANIDDVGGILELIEPLEQQGILVRRSRELLEMEIDHFILMERDGMIIACAGLYPFPDDAMAELACLAVHKDYQRSQRGETLLALLEKQALQQNIDKLFVLSSKTTHWFLEKGFELSDINALPIQKKSLYNYQRRSKVFTKHLSEKRI